MQAGLHGTACILTIVCDLAPTPVHPVIAHRAAASCEMSLVARRSGNDKQSRREIKGVLQTDSCEFESSHPSARLQAQAADQTWKGDARPHSRQDEAAGTAAGIKSNKDSLLVSLAIRVAINVIMANRISSTDTPAVPPR
jgi:hypothetical protein